MELICVVEGGNHSQLLLSNAKASLLSIGEQKVLRLCNII